MATVEMKVRIDKDTRDEMQRIASNLGMSVNSAFSMFARQFVMHRGLPFDVVECEQDRRPVWTEEEYCAEMQRRLDEVRAGKYVEHDLIEA